MRIKNLLLGASALIGMGWLFPAGMAAAAAAALATPDLGGGTPAVRSTHNSKHRKWKRARASGRHDFRQSLP